MTLGSDGRPARSRLMALKDRVSHCRGVTHVPPLLDKLKVDAR